VYECARQRSKLEIPVYVSNFTDLSHELAYSRTLASNSEGPMKTSLWIIACKQEHPIPRDLNRQLPPPQRNSRYVAVGGHVAQIDNKQRVQDLIHLELSF